MRADRRRIRSFFQRPPPRWKGKEENQCGDRSVFLVAFKSFVFRKQKPHRQRQGEEEEEEQDIDDRKNVTKSLSILSMYIYLLVFNLTRPVLGRPVHGRTERRSSSAHIYRYRK